LQEKNWEPQPAMQVAAVFDVALGALFGVMFGALLGALFGIARAGAA
jgi:hypothetical protein